MTKTTYISVVSILFLIVGVVHIMRIINGWDVNIGGYDVPLFASWIGAIVTLYLSFQGLVSKNK